jgi:hypothetical protein
MKQFSFLCAVGALVSAAGLASATPINHGNRAGVTVDFLNITEDSNTDPVPPALFGSPTVSVDSLVFNPVSFGASAQNGSFDITDGTLTTRIDARPGFTIPSFNITERGDYTLAGSGTAATNATVSLSIFITVLEVNDVPINAQSFSGYAGTFSPSGGTYDLVNDAGVLVQWNGSATVNIDAALASRGIMGSATSVIVTINNQLLAFSQPGTVAFIKKKDIGGVIITVPTPGAMALVGAGALMASRRRR